MMLDEPSIASNVPGKLGRGELPGGPQQRQGQTFRWKESEAVAESETRWWVGQ